jgi:hypothetical protein
MATDTILADALRAEANARAAEIGLLSPSSRLDAVQDAAVCTRCARQYPDNFFGWAESI